MLDWLRRRMHKEHELDMREQSLVDNLVDSYVNGVLDISSVACQMPDTPFHWKYFWERVHLSETGRLNMSSTGKQKGPCEKDGQQT